MVEFLVVLCRKELGVESGQTPPLPCRILTLPQVRGSQDYTSTSSLPCERLYRSVMVLAAFSGNVIVALGVHGVVPFPMVSHRVGN
jgi:hypothetical protein